MNNQDNNKNTRPTVKQIEKEISRLKAKRETRKAIFGTLRTLILIAAASVLVANLLLSVLVVNRSSMNPTLSEGEVVIAVRLIKINKGDVIAFHYNNKILIKRVIAKAGDWVNIENDGTVYINNEKIDEPYVKEKSLGECDITMPYQVPDGTVFVMGDNRQNSADSRLFEIGPVNTDLIVGKVLIRIWSLKEFGLIK